MSALKYWVWFASAGSMGAAAAGRVLAHFGSPENVYYAGAAEYAAVEGIRQNDVRQLTNKDLTAANDILSSCDEIGCRIITLHDAQYPGRLRNTYDPPVVLYLRGKMPAIDEEAAIAVVGTRNCTPYGRSAAESICCELGRRGLLVVTGLAKGIDTAAARGALMGGGRVVGVIGSGLDVIYPRENKGLFDDVARDGTILSEYPPGTSANAWHFPARNRILSGLSLGVAVLEAPKKSGALITAARALEQGRDVFALPGNIDAKNSEGSNALLREGAIPLLSGENIIEEYAQLYPDKIKPAKSDSMLDPGAARHPAAAYKNKEIDNATEVEYIEKILAGLSGGEKVIAEAIGTSAMLADEIIAASNISAPQAMSALTMLELKGHVERNSGGYYSIV